MHNHLCEIEIKYILRVEEGLADHLFSSPQRLLYGIKYVSEPTVVALILRFSYQLALSNSQPPRQLHLQTKMEAKISQGASRTLGKQNCTRTQISNFL